MAYEPDGKLDQARNAYLEAKKELHALTGFRPQTSLTEIIDRVAAYYRQKEEPFAAVAAAKAPH